MAGPLSIEFALPGTPIPQGSEKILYFGPLCPACRTKPIAKVTHDNSNVLGWRNEIRRLAAVAMRRAVRPWRGPVRSELIFVVPAPKAIPKDRHGYPIVPPDVDKLARAVHDACTGTVYVDDAQIVEHITRKRYPEPGEKTGVIVRMAALVPEAEEIISRPSVWEGTT